MKSTLLGTFLGLLLLAACEYNVPLTTDHNVSIDPAVLGSWKIASIENKDDDTEIRIHQFSDTEYAVHYLEDGGNLYFRAYAINVGGVSAIQLELIGSGEKSVGRDEDDRYHVASYKIVDDLLHIGTLNSDLVDDELPDSESLRSAFIKHKDNPELFNDPGVFRRVKN
jgi:hypothetical protein